MERKRWTAKEAADESTLRQREKKKWQIALRRYVLEKQPSYQYAPYFGLDIENFRTWIALQFDETMNWDNFSTAWQFDHVVPVHHFDLSNDDDARLCWNFTNIRIQKTEQGKTKPASDSLAVAKTYFNNLFMQTQYPVCGQMLAKIAVLETLAVADSAKQSRFVQENIDYLNTLLQDCGPHEFDQLNNGQSLDAVLKEKAFLASRDR